MMLAGQTFMCRKRFCDSFKLKKSWRTLETADHPEEVEKHCLSDPEKKAIAGRQNFLAFHLENLISGATTSWLRSDSSFQFRNQFFSLSFSDLKTSSRPSRPQWKIFKFSADSTSFDHTNFRGWCCLLHPNAAFGHCGWCFLKKNRDAAVVSQ